MEKLEYGQMVKINGKRGTVFTVRGYAEQYYDDVDVVLKREIESGHSLYGINQEPGILVNDRGWMKRQNEMWNNVVVLEHGQKVLIDGEELFVKFKGNYSDMADFVKELI